MEHSSKPTKDFNPELHLDFKPPEYIITMGGLGFRRGTGFSTVAASGPFSLFSAPGLAAVRKELRGQLMPDCVHQISGIGKQTYGIAPRYEGQERLILQSDSYLQICTVQLQLLEASENA